VAKNKGVSFSVNGIADLLNGMADRSKLMTGWLNRVAYPELLKVQRVRWQTEGSSEGGKWVALNPSYRTAKLKRFADYPGSGTKMLVATSRLVGSMTGDNKAEHWKLVKGNELTMGSIVPYAGYVDETRDITTLSDATVTRLAEAARNYIMTGNMKR
jgi:hypothetical protein